jgi:hypothetical protein
MILSKLDLLQGVTQKVCAIISASRLPSMDSHLSVEATAVL